MILMWSHLFCHNDFYQQGHKQYLNMFLAFVLNHTQHRWKQNMDFSLLSITSGRGHYSSLYANFQSTIYRKKVKISSKQTLWFTLHILYNTYDNVWLSILDTVFSFSMFYLTLRETQIRNLPLEMWNVSSSAQWYQISSTAIEIFFIKQFFFLTGNLAVFELFATGTWAWKCHHPLLLL